MVNVNRQRGLQSAKVHIDVKTNLPDPSVGVSQVVHHHGQFNMYKKKRPRNTAGQTKKHPRQEDVSKTCYETKIRYLFIILLILKTE